MRRRRREGQVCGRKDDMLIQWLDFVLTHKRWNPKLKAV